ncbi:BatA domain-containing protein [Inediibacterium massiliense]|uniref:BatA domain-containing protein n=1 Tax=Inediibacterium massiliense TaxID=1658111 RepID=UPI0006B6917E|nr:BatA domain-containing protein [Inediibacterium massiliense]
MRFLNPLGLLSGLSLGAILFLYFKKKQVIEQKVSSLFLWEEVIKEVEGVKSKKIDHWILLLIQLFIALLIVFCIAKPIGYESFKGKEITIGLDCSYSMKAMEKGKSHFEEGKNKIFKILQNTDKNTKVNLILLKEENSIPIERGSKEDIKNYIKNIHCTDESLDLTHAYESMKNFSGKKMIVTNKEIPIKASIVKVGEKLKNIGIHHIDYDFYTKKALVTIENNNKEDEEILVSMMNEKNQKDMKKVKINGLEKENISFHVPIDSKKVKIQIENEDMLKEDNTSILLLGEENQKRVFLGIENEFLEKALQSIPYIKLVKKEDHPELYIVDQIDPSLKNQKVWVMNQGEILKDPVNISKKDSIFVKDMTLKNSYTKNSISSKKGYLPILMAEKRPLMTYGKEDEKRVESIDFKYSNIVYTPDFPILIQNTIDWFLDGEYLNFYQPPKPMVKGELKDTIKTENNKIENIEIHFTKYIVFFILLLMVLEWEVYRRAS